MNKKPTKVIALSKKDYNEAVRMIESEHELAINRTRIKKETIRTVMAVVSAVIQFSTLLLFLHYIGHIL